MFFVWGKAGYAASGNFILNYIFFQNTKVRLKGMAFLPYER